MRIARSLLVGAVLLAFVSDALAGYVPRPVAEKLTVRVVHAQDNVIVDMPDTGNGAVAAGALLGGMIGGALVGGAIALKQAHTAQANVAPVLPVLEGYDFNARMEQALRTKLVSADVSPSPEFDILLRKGNTFTPADPNRTREFDPRPFVIEPHYAFDYEFTELRVRLLVTWQHLEQKKGGKIKALVPTFQRTYTFHMPLPGADHTGAPWAALGRDKLTAALDQGIVQVTDMLAHDFTEKGRAEWEVSNQKMQATLAGKTYPGMALRATDDMLWVRTGKFYDTTQTIEGYQTFERAVANAPKSMPAVADATAAAPAAAPAPAEPQATPDAAAAATGSGQ